jgi:hypothetical protein
VPRSLAAALACLLAGCTSVKVSPDAQLPHAVMQPMNVHAGLVLEQELRTYVHEESRGGGQYAVDLGPGHEHMFKDVLGASIADLQVFNSVDAARAATGMQALFVPHIEQFSFATANETSGAYWAATIVYRISVLSPQGELVDTLTLTGYGSALGSGRSTLSLRVATQAAMRDAAAKLLVQLPRQALTQKMVAGQSLSAADISSAAIDVIELVPII